MLLPDLIRATADRQADAMALVDGDRMLSYSELWSSVRRFATRLKGEPGFSRGSRVAVWLDHRLEHVVACFGAAAAGCIFVPVNPVLKPEQVRHVLRDSGAWRLVTTSARYAGLTDPPPAILVEDRPGPLEYGPCTVAVGMPAVVDSDVAAILYTSGSTGRPKGVVLTHRNLVAGAQSVVSYLGNGPHDTLLALLPLSFDAGFSQLTTAFCSGAKAVLHNHLLPADTLEVIDRHGVTGLTAVPPLYQRLLTASHREGAGRSLRYFASTGGRMPLVALQALRTRWPQAKPFLMYGLTEAFRSTYLPPTEIDRRPESIGRAIPNAEILVLREDGSECGVDEPGELVHRGPLVAQGYWGDPAATGERFRPLPAMSGGRPDEVVPRDLAVFSGDTVRRDAEGFLYFVGRRDEMIKTSGYRVSPLEIEEVIYASGLVGECAAVGFAHEALGQGIRVVVTPAADAGTVDIEALMAVCRRSLPAYLVPMEMHVVAGPLPRNPNGKIDRKRIASDWGARMETNGAAKHGPDALSDQ